MIDAAKIEELRGLLAADTSTDWQTIRADPAKGADVWWICAKNAAGQEVELGSLQGGFPHPTREARARLIVAMRNALPELLDLASSLASAGEDGELCKALTSYQQADEEGVMVLVSRQACDEAATRIRALASQVDGLRREIEIRDPVAKRREEQLSALKAENERLRKALLRLQTGAAVALDALPEDQQEGVVGNFLAAIHRECCAGLCASKGADECKEATP